MSKQKFKLTQSILKNSLLLSGEITNEALLPLTQYLAKRKKGTLIINSEGGDVITGFAMYDLIKASGADLTAVVVGQCQSISILLLLACQTRYSLSNGRLMIHHGSFEMDQPENQREMAGIIKELLDLDEIYQKIIVENTNLTTKQVENNMKHGCYFDSKQALKDGFIQAIL